MNNNLLRRTSKWKERAAELSKNKWIYLMFLPVLIWYAIFAYWPMYGILISFQKFNIVKGMAGSDWVGIKNFMLLFNDPYFPRILRNTLLLNIYSLIFGFPVPIILALLFNEIKQLTFKKVTQTISYLPYFISTVVICGMVLTFLSPSTGTAAADSPLNTHCKMGAWPQILRTFLPASFQPIYLIFQ